MSLDHYFSQEPSSEFVPKPIQIELAGKVCEVMTASGTFSPSQLDVGTKILLDRIDLAPKTGNVLDLGCGWGPIALALGHTHPACRIFAVDVNTRALELTKLNAKKLGVDNIQVFTPDEVPAELSFDGIWSNPPIRIGKKALHDLLQHWIPRLTAGGEAYLVVQKNLGSDSLQKWLMATFENDFEVTRLLSEKTYRIIKIKKLAKF